MKKAEEIIKYRQDISRRFRKLEDAIDNDCVSVSQARELRKNYNLLVSFNITPKLFKFL